MKYLSGIACLLLFVCASARAQTLFNLDFSDAQVPAAWTSSTTAPDPGFRLAWSSWFSTPGFQVPEHGFFLGTSDDLCNCDKSEELFISPVLDCSGIGIFSLQMDMFFLGRSDPAVGPERIFVDWSQDGGQSWTAQELTGMKKNKWQDDLVIDASPLAGAAQARLRFRYSDSGGKQGGLALDNIRLIRRQPYDLSVVSATPVDSQQCRYSTAESIGLKLLNKGYEAASGFEIQYNLLRPDGSEQVVKQAIGETVQAGQALALNFAEKADMSIPGIYQLRVRVNYPQELLPEDNALEQSVKFSSGELVLSGTGGSGSDQYWTLWSTHANNWLMASGGFWAKDKPFREYICLPDTGCYYLVYNGTTGPYSTVNPDFKIEYNDKVIYIPEVINDPIYNQPVHENFNVYGIGGGCPALDVQLKDAFISPIIPLNEAQLLEGQIVNYGRDTIRSLEIGYRIDAGPSQLMKLHGIALAPSRTLSFEHDKNVHYTSGLVNHEMVVKVDQLNGQADERPHDNVDTLPFSIVEKRAKHAVLFEEATGTWCGWCVRGIVFMEKITKENPETAIGVAVHNADPMVLPEWDGAMGQYLSGYPGGWAARRLMPIDPSAFPEALPYILKHYPPVADMQTTAVYNPANSSLAISVSATFIADNSADLRLNALIVEDGVTGTGPAWAQNNVYSGGGQGPMGGFENLPSPVPAEQMVYDHVGRALLGGAWGSAGSVPAQQKRGETYTKTYTYTVPPHWDIQQLKVIGVLQQWNSHITQRPIINAIQVKPDLSLGVSDPGLEASLRVYPNPAIRMISADFSLQSPERLQIELIDLLGRIVHHQESFFAAGANQVQIHAGQARSGSYFLRLSSGSGQAMRKVMLLQE